MDSSLPAHVGVYGGGRMGAGIAHVLLRTGRYVTLVEKDDDTARAAHERIVTGLQRTVPEDEAGARTELSRLVTRSASEDLAGCGLVIEAVPEIFDLKMEILATIESANPGGYIATNTSALSIDLLGDALEDPGQFIGLHFFNPVPVSDLVEIVRGQQTTRKLVDAASAWVAELGKTGIVVGDSPGFATSRLGVAIALEAMRMLEEGLASVEDIDTAMVLGYRHAMGPLKTTDIIGLDVRLSIAEHLERELGPRFTPPQILRDKVAEGHFGRKTGQGFYSWS